MSVFKSQSWQCFLIDVVNQVHVAWNGVHFGILKNYIQVVLAMIAFVIFWA